MRQRVCIALAIASSKQLLIADEPGTSLDVTIQDQILRLLNRIAAERQMAIILISHSLGVIREWTDRVYVMYAGSIVEETTTEELFTNPLHPYTQALESPTISSLQLAVGSIPAAPMLFLYVLKKNQNFIKLMKIIALPVIYSGRVPDEHHT